MNALRVIHPYKYKGTWVFDDEQVGLVREPFVAGADEIIERMVAGITNAEQGFSLVFSDRPFPGYDAKLEWRREEYDGNWYFSADLDMEGWLCPALLLYFDAPPRELYAQFKSRVE